MNLEGAAVERLLGKTVMPHFHAAFSGGTVLSRPSSAPRCRGAGVPLLAHFAGAVVVTVALGLWAVRSFLPRDGRGRRAEEQAAAAAAAHPPALGLAASRGP